jgi:hypothetical protein
VRRRQVVACALALCALAACGGNGEESPDPDTRLDPGVLPVTKGAWYRPAVDVSWQWQLDGRINTRYRVELYDVDLFETPDAVFARLHGRGAKVLCYFSAGSSETGRPDFRRIPESAQGEQLSGYPNERWLDLRSRAVFDVMTARLDLARRRGCDGVEPDNVDGHTNDTGFPLTALDLLAFNRNLANEAHRRGLAVALKNAGGQARRLVDYYDLELNEECFFYEECNQLRPFLAHAKPVLNVEYADSLEAANRLAASVCPRARAAGLRTLLLPENLDDEFRVSCF